jgi:hypothetical protein
VFLSCIFKPSSQRIADNLLIEHATTMAATITSAAGALTTASAGDLATVSMTADANYQIAGTCIQECLFWVEGKIPNGLGLPYQLGCLRNISFLLPLTSFFPGMSFWGIWGD